MRKITNFLSDNGNDPVGEVIMELDPDLQDKVIAGIATLRVLGTDAKSELLKIRKLRGKILELKISNFRVLFAFRPGNEIILLHAFIKKRQKTDIDDIELAEKRLRKYTK